MTTIPRRLILVFVAATLPVLCLAASTPRDAMDGLLAADRAFSAASAKTDLVSGLTAMLAEDVIVPNPPGQFLEGRDAVRAALRANADEAGSRAEWRPLGGGISADGEHGFTAGVMTIQRPDKTTLAMKYLAYWVKGADGWRSVAYKRVRAGAGNAPTARLAPILPRRLVPVSHDPARIDRHRADLARAERSFSDEAQRIGLGPAFERWGSADALNLAGGGEAGFVVGAANIARLVGAGQPAGGSTLVWAPDTVIVASSGDLGVTIGVIHLKAPAAGERSTFPFFTIWRRASASAPWRYIAE